MKAALDDGAELLTSPRTRNLRIVGRLKPGISIEQARAALGLVAHHLSQRFPEAEKDFEIEVYPERRARPAPAAAGPFLAASSLFLCLAGLVLLLACGNVANILLVRGTVRQREMAIRAALGGSRTRLIRSQLTESVLLALIGGVTGMFLGLWFSHLLSSIDIQTNLPVILDFSFRPQRVRLRLRCCATHRTHRRNRSGPACVAQRSERHSSSGRPLDIRRQHHYATLW